MSSRASRTVGDVLPDLERGDFASVREALRERDRLLVERGHLVRPISAAIALGPDRRRSALEVRFGLWLRRKLAAGEGTIPQNSEALDLKRSLKPENGWTVLGFDSAICEFPERLLAEWMNEAVAGGAVVRNYCRVLQVKVSGGEVCGVSVRDMLTGVEQFIAATRVINATGASLDHLSRQAEVRSARGIATIRGSHLVLRHFPGAPSGALYAEGIDGRPVALIPWNGQLLFGTSQVDDLPASGSPRASDAEMDFLRCSFERLFPQAQPIILSTFTGLATMPLDRGHGAAGNRCLVVDHAEFGARGLLSVFGGSLTSASTAARECARKLGWHSPPPVNSRFLAGSANGVDIALKHWAHTVAAFARISQASAEAIATWHGRRALCVARLAQADEYLRKPICNHSVHIIAEAVHAVRYERAVHLADVLLRRVPVALAPCWSAQCTRLAAQRIGRALHWSDARIAQEAGEFEAELANFLVKPQLRNLATVPPDSLAA